MKIEINAKSCLDVKIELPSRAQLIVTASSSRDYWLFRVPLTKTIALAAVPEFGGVNLHFQSRTASDYVAPYESNARDILRILRGLVKGAVPNDEILKALRSLQDEVRKWRGCHISRRTKKIEP